jgi:hypothetical protein
VIAAIGTRFPLNRTDLIGLAKKNTELSESEKIRLEQLQRADRSLRQKYREKS